MSHKREFFHLFLNVLALREVELYGRLEQGWFTKECRSAYVSEVAFVTQDVLLGVISNVQSYNFMLDLN